MNLNTSPTVSHHCRMSSLSSRLGRSIFGRGSYASPSFLRSLPSYTHITSNLMSRFHADVQRDFEIRKADVVELHQPLSESMDELQTAIIECMDATLAEIKRSNTTVRYLSIPKNLRRIPLAYLTANGTGSWRLKTLLWRTHCSSPLMP